MQERDELKEMMDGIIQQVSMDSATGIKRFLQANPYSTFDYYNFDILKDKSDLFEKTLYYESPKSELYKKQICRILENPNGKNTFFLVGYQGCGKSTFIHSVINMYQKKIASQVVIIDCDKVGRDVQQIRKVICKLLKKTVKNTNSFTNFLDFYNKNSDVIEDLNNDNFSIFQELVQKCHIGETPEKNRKELYRFINSNLSIKDAFYLLILWKLACNYNDETKIGEKLMIFVDNLDCVDEYHELSEFISCIDAITVDFSDIFENFQLCGTKNIKDTFVSKIKIFVAMRETTKANLPSSHFSDAFKSIYTNKDMTEWYDKGEIIKNRILKLMEYDKNKLLNETQYRQLELIMKVTEDIYTKNVIYPLFNNNYRSAVDMLVDIIISHTGQMEIYSKLMNSKIDKYKHGARGVLYKYIFDEFNKGEGSEESSFKRIGVIDLLNRKNNSVSICRLILSYLSNYTETRCDSGRNSITLEEVIYAFKDIFNETDVIKILCEMFALRDSKWTHLVSFNQIEYEEENPTIKNHIDIKTLNPNKTMLHYSCAGKIYIEYVATHFEFFTSRVFKERKEALFCDSNLEKDKNTNNYKCCDIINKIFSEVKRCCISLKEFNEKICEKNNYLNPYDTIDFYRDSPYICMFKRIDFENKERRFKQFHEERILLTHINYIDCYRLYVLNHYDKLPFEEKKVLNEKLTGYIKKYVNLLKSNIVLKNPYTYDEFITYYEKQIELLETDWSNFEIEISKNRES